MGRIGFAKIALIATAFCIATVVASRAQTFTPLLKFNGANGQWPMFGPLLQGIDGDFYGTTSWGGSGCSSCGTVFKITSNGKLTTVYNFGSQPEDGADPIAGLIQNVEGNFYGTTTGNGATAGAGTIFELTPAGQLTTLYNFCSQLSSRGYCLDGTGSAAPMFEATNGNFYGASDSDIDTAYDEIFQLTPAGKFTPVYRNPDTGGISVVQATNGNFYGVQQVDGYLGEFFELTSAGKITPLYTFPQSAGYPGNLINGLDGNFYGTTDAGGASNSGTIFKLTTTGEYTLLYSFCSQANCADGGSPNKLVQATDGNFYGTNQLGGAVKVNDIFVGYGTVFQFTLAGQLTTLHTFCLQSGECSDGAYPMSGLTQGTDGNFYGVTYGLTHCPGNCGTVFSLSMGLAPFAEANPNFGKVGQVVGILGNNLKGTTSVTFNGVSAEFKVESATYLKAQVPTGATNGTIEVTTPSGTLSSNVVFQVLP